jgi:hypothetical protein
MKKCPSCYAIMANQPHGPRFLRSCRSQQTARPRSQRSGSDMSVANVVTRKSRLPAPVRGVDDPF